MPLRVSFPGSRALTTKQIQEVREREREWALQFEQVARPMSIPTAVG